MSGRPTVYISPLTFGFGPASHATAVARAVRDRRADAWVVGVGDGVAADFMVASESFDDVVVAPRGLFPDVPARGATVVVSVGDFERALGARRLGTRVVVVDALYWMWERPPLYPNAVDRYLCLAFPGVEERVRRAAREDASLGVIPQIRADRLPAAGRAPRGPGLLLNLGGGASAYGSCDEFFAALIACVAAAARSNAPAAELLVTSSTAAHEALQRAGAAAGLTVASLPFDAMMDELGRRARLLTIPGQSIVAEAVGTGIPTILLPGAHYSHHRQAAVYREHLAGVSVVGWSDIGYADLPGGLPEDEAGARAVELANAFAADAAARSRLTRVLGEHLRRPALIPRFRDAEPWSSFDGAAHVAGAALELLAPSNVAPTWREPAVVDARCS